jgi:hypothetical protein
VVEVVYGEDMDNIVDINKPRKASAGNGSGGGFNMSDLEKRVDKLELKTDRLQESLNRIELILSEIRGELKTKASAVELAEVKGKISQIPNTWQMITMILGSQITLFGLFFALMKFGIK